MKVGYIRTYYGNDMPVFTQERLLRQNGCERVILESASANTDSNRPEFDKMVNNFENGDTLIVASLCIVVKSIAHLFEFMSWLHVKGVTLISVDENIDTSSSYGRIFIEHCLAIKNIEVRLQAERTSLSHEFRRTSNRLGRKGITTKAQIKAEKAVELYKDASKTVNEICEELDITRATFYRYLRHMGLVVAGR